MSSRMYKTKTKAKAKAKANSIMAITYEMKKLGESIFSNVKIINDTIKVKFDS